MPNLGYSGAESPGWFDVSPKNSAGLPQCGSLSTDSQLSLKCLCHTFICTELIASPLKAFWIIWIVFTEECSGLMQNLMQTVALLAQSFWMRRPHSTHAHSTVSPSPLTSTVKLYLFTHVPSSPLSLASRLHWCHANHSHYIKNGWTFSRQTSYIPVPMPDTFSEKDYFLTR